MGKAVIRNHTETYKVKITKPSTAFGKRLSVVCTTYAFFLPPFLPFDKRLFLPTAMFAAS